MAITVGFCPKTADEKHVQLLLCAGSTDPSLGHIVAAWNLDSVVRRPGTQREEHTKSKAQKPRDQAHRKSRSLQSKHHAAHRYGTRNDVIQRAQAWQTALEARAKGVAIKQVQKGVASYTQKTVISLHGVP